MRVLTTASLKKRYQHLKLEKPELVTLAIYDYVKEEQVFALGDVLRHLRKVFAVTLIYRTFDELALDGWFVLGEATLTQRSRYVFQKHIWRPTAYQGRCVWKQSELRNFDERNISSTRRVPEFVMV